MQVQHKKGQNPYFKLKDIAKTFGITKALNGVTLDIYAGEVIDLSLIHICCGECTGRSCRCYSGR